MDAFFGFIMNAVTGIGSSPISEIGKICSNVAKPSIIHGIVDHSGCGLKNVLNREVMGAKVKDHIKDFAVNQVKNKVKNEAKNFIFGSEEKDDSKKNDNFNKLHTKYGSQSTESNQFFERRARQPQIEETNRRREYENFITQIQAQQNARKAQAEALAAQRKAQYVKQLEQRRIQNELAQRKAEFEYRQREYAIEQRKREIAYAIAQRKKQMEYEISQSQNEHMNYQYEPNYRYVPNCQYKHPRALRQRYYD